MSMPRMVLAATLPSAVMGFMPSATQLQLAGKRAPIISAHQADTLQPKRTGVRWNSVRSKDCLNMKINLGSSAVSMIAGVDGMEIPDYDGFYFAGVVVCVVCAGLLQYNAAQGKTGLGKYLSSGPEDKNWEQRQSREAQEQNVKINEANKGSFFASILPKLDFVEVYGQDKPPRAEEEGQTAQDAVGGVTSVSDAVKAASAGAASVSEQITDISVLEKLSKDMSEAIVRQDFAKAAELKEKFNKLRGDQ